MVQCLISKSNFIQLLYTKLMIYSRIANCGTLMELSPLFINIIMLLINADSVLN